MSIGISRSKKSPDNKGVCWWDERTRQLGRNVEHVLQLKKGGKEKVVRGCKKTRKTRKRPSRAKETGIQGNDRLAFARSQQAIKRALLRKNTPSWSKRKHLIEAFTSEENKWSSPPDMNVFNSRFMSRLRCLRRRYRLPPNEERASDQAPTFSNSLYASGHSLRVRSPIPIDHRL